MARGKYSGSRFDDYDLIDVTGSAPGVVFTDSPKGADDSTVDDDVDKGAGTDAAGDAEGTDAPAQPYNPTAALRGFLYRVVAPPDQKPARPARTARPAPSATGRRTPAELVHGLDRRERIISLVAAALAFAFAISILIIYPHPPAHPAKGTVYIEPWVIALIVGVPAIGMGVGVALARRALVGFMAVLAGFATLTVVGVYGLLYFGLGMWLIMRASRYSKQVREASGEQPPARRTRADRAGTATRSSARPAGRQTSRPAGKQAATLRAPAQSKRYTPPRNNAIRGRGRTPTS